MASPAPHAGWCVGLGISVISEEGHIDVFYVQPSDDPSGDQHLTKPECGWGEEQGAALGPEVP